MPAVSKKQRRFLGIAHAIKKGKLPKTFSTEAAKVAKTMKAKELKHFAKTKEKGLPLRKKRKNR
jgi:hypothetical protein